MQLLKYIQKRCSIGFLANKFVASIIIDAHNVSFRPNVGIQLLYYCNYPIFTPFQASRVPNCSLVITLIIRKSLGLRFIPFIDNIMPQMQTMQHVLKNAKKWKIVIQSDVDRLKSEPTVFVQILLKYIYQWYSRFINYNVFNILEIFSVFFLHHSFPLGLVSIT